MALCNQDAVMRKGHLCYCNIFYSMRETSVLIDDPKVTRVIMPILSRGVMQNRSDDCPPLSTLHQYKRVNSSSGGRIRAWVGLTHT